MPAGIEVYWVPSPYRGRLAIMPRPRGGDWLEDELRSLHELGIELLVCLLTDDELRELDLAAEEHAAGSAGIRFHRFPIYDMGVPVDAAGAAALIDELAGTLAAGRSVAIHCRGGIGRSGTIAACVLVQCGLATVAAMEQVSVARGYPVPETATQALWIEAFERRCRLDTKGSDSNTGPAGPLGER